MNDGIHFKIEEGEKEGCKQTITFYETDSSQKTWLSLASSLKVGTKTSTLSGFLSGKQRKGMQDSLGKGDV